MQHRKALVWATAEDYAKGLRRDVTHDKESETAGAVGCEPKTSSRQHWSSDEARSKTLCTFEKVKPRHPRLREDMR